MLVLLGATSAHISVNTLNEYYDFKSGLDFTTKKTAFSGGSGGLPGAPEMANIVLMVGVVSLLITIGIGTFFIVDVGLQLLPVGIIGVLIIITYTQWLNRAPFLCLVAPGAGFGVLMVVGTHIVLTGGYAPIAWLVSIPPFFLINNLLLLNQYPDIKADASVGRNTFPIAFGLRKSHIVYGVFAFAAYSLIVFLIAAGHLPRLSSIALIPVVFSLFSLVGAIKYSSNIGEFPAYLGANVVAAIFTPMLLGFSLIFG
jgi:1,4-dihydroxy-2-naphthoate octaprenyltransferase